MDERGAALLFDVTSKGWSLIKDLILFDDQPRQRLTWAGRRRLRKAAQLYAKGLEVDPECVGCMYNLGKIRQRLGEFEAAWTWFDQAAGLDKSHIALAREATVSAVRTDRGAAAVAYGLRAVALGQNQPPDLANLALAYLVQGDVRLATDAAELALAGGPDDKVSQNVRRLLVDVVEGRKTRAAAIHEVQQAKY